MSLLGRRATASRRGECAHSACPTHPPRRRAALRGSISTSSALFSILMRAPLAAPRQKLDPHARPPQLSQVLLTSSLVLLYMDRCFTYEVNSFHSGGEGGDLLEEMFDVMFEEIFVHTCSFSRALFFIHARLLPNASGRRGIGGTHAGLRQSGP